jgi:hypothetical protein
MGRRTLIPNHRFYRSSFDNYRLTVSKRIVENGEMNLAIIFAVALGCFVAERLWPAMKLPRVNAWWGRVVLINSIQFGITVLAGRTWNRWLNHVSLFDLKEHCGDWSSALIIYLFSTFVYYWWHRYRHESQFLWRTLHQIHHSARRLEIVTSFYKHPVEIWINSILSSLIVFPLFGGSLRAAGYYTILIAVGEFFYHWNIRTPSWLGFIFQTPNRIGSTINSVITPIILPIFRFGTFSSARSKTRKTLTETAASKAGVKTALRTCSLVETSTHPVQRSSRRSISCQPASVVRSVGPAPRRAFRPRRHRFRYCHPGPRLLSE